VSVGVFVGLGVGDGDGVSVGLGVNVGEGDGSGKFISDDSERTLSLRYLLSMKLIPKYPSMKNIDMITIDTADITNHFISSYYIWSLS